MAFLAYLIYTGRGQLARTTRTARLPADLQCYRHNLAHPASAVLSKSGAKQRLALARHVVPLGHVPIQFDPRFRRTARVCLRHEREPFIQYIDEQCEKARNARRQRQDAALTGPAACAAVGGQCVIGGGQDCSHVGQQTATPIEIRAARCVALIACSQTATPSRFESTHRDTINLQQGLRLRQIGKKRMHALFGPVPERRDNTVDLTRYRNDLERRWARRSTSVAVRRPCAAMRRSRLPVSKLSNPAQNACEVVGGECMADAGHVSSRRSARLRRGRGPRLARCAVWTRCSPSATLEKHSR